MVSWSMPYRLTPPLALCLLCNFWALHGQGRHWKRKWFISLLSVCWITLTGIVRNTYILEISLDHFHFVVYLFSFWLDLRPLFHPSLSTLWICVDLKLVSLFWNSCSLLLNNPCRNYHFHQALSAHASCFVALFWMVINFVKLEVNPV